MKVLLIDDMRLVRMQLREALADHHDIVEAASGYQAIDAATGDRDIAMVVCDIHMPGLDGISTCRKIRELPRMGQVLVAMMSTDPTPALKRAAKDAGARLWLLKPLVVEEIAVALQALMDGDSSG